MKYINKQLSYRCTADTGDQLWYLHALQKHVHTAHTSQVNRATCQTRHIWNQMSPISFVISHVFPYLSAYTLLALRLFVNRYLHLITPSACPAYYPIVFWSSYSVIYYKHVQCNSFHYTMLFEYSCIHWGNWSTPTGKRRTLILSTSASPLLN